MSTNLTAEIRSGKTKATGFATPKQDRVPQKMRVPPRRVIPVIFLPGIMGSNLRMSRSRQEQLKRPNNVAWNPDRINETVHLMHASPAERQLQLDQSVTEVDVYDPVTNPTGDGDEDADERHGAAIASGEIKQAARDQVLLIPASYANGASADQRARYRGWGEVFFGSYGNLLAKCEICLNSLSADEHWNAVLNIDPREWGAVPESKLSPLSKAERDKALKGCLFPVHAVGYNWLQSNFQSSLKVRQRIEAIIGLYKERGFDCRKVILITHSMGGLVARALTHPSIGAFSDSILGVVHGVMPAVGAPAAYKRIRCGVDGLDLAGAVLGRTGRQVAAVLGNSPGGLELLPSKQYGNKWLRFTENEVELAALPLNGDPYQEIYQVEDKWYGLLASQWLNPARDKLGGPARTRGLLVVAKHFHELVADTYHPNSYAHYGVDSKRPSWETITWKLDSANSRVSFEGWRIQEDSGQGTLRFMTGESKLSLPITPHATLAASNGSGDETVPQRSSSMQLKSGKLCGVFQQKGYEHQASYSDEHALNSTIYSIVRIAQSMRWD